MMTNKNKNSNTSWPYHLYTGSDPRKQGSYVKCKNNPCLIHGGTDIIATSPEDAYEKANVNNSWGWNASAYNANDNNNVSMTASSNKKSLETGFSNDNESNTVIQEKSDDSEENHENNQSSELIDKSDKLSSLKENKNSKKNSELKDSVKNTYAPIKYDENGNRLYGVGEHLFAFPEVETKECHYDENTPGFIEARNQYLTEHGLNVYDSPLYHKIDSDITAVELSKQIFPDCVNTDDKDVYKSLAEKGKHALSMTTDLQRKALLSYFATGYRNMNQILEKKNPFEGFEDEKSSLKETKQSIRSITRFLNSHDDLLQLQQDTVLFRTRYMRRHRNKSRGGEELSYYKAVAESMKTGGDAMTSRPDFMSTAMSGYAYNNVAEDEDDEFETQFIIKAPAGTRGVAYTKAMEDEFLIDKNNDIKIVGIYETSELVYDSVDLKLSKKTYRSGFHFKTRPIIAVEIIPKKTKKNKENNADVKP